METTPNTPVNEHAEPDLREQLEFYMRKWPWFIMGVLICMTVAFLYLRYSTAQYKTTTSIIIKDSKGRGAASELAAFEDIGLISGMNTNSIENEIEILRSKRLFRRVVEKLNLNIRYYTEGNIKITEVYKNTPFTVKVLNYNEEVPLPETPLQFTILSPTTVSITNPETDQSLDANFGDRIDLDFASITLVPEMERLEALENNRSLLVQFSSVEQIVGLYQSRVQVNPIAKNASVIELSLNDPVREKAQDILNELVIQYNEDAINDRNLVANNTANFIDERLQIITAELDSVETDKVTFKQDNRITSLEAEAELFLSSASEFNKQQITFETQLELINDLMRYLDNRSEIGLLPANLGIAEGGMEELISNYNQLVLERTRMLRSSTEQNPVVINLTNQINELRGSIMSGLDNVKNAIETNLRDLRRQESIFGSKIAEVPGKEKQFRGIERQQTIKEALYLFLLQKREETSISLAVTAPKAKVVDAAYSSSNPVSPKRNIIYLAALLLGLLIPFLIFYLHQLLYDKVSTRKDIERSIGSIPFVGEIPKIVAKEVDFIKRNDTNVLAESFRILRTNLQYLLVNKHHSESGKTIFVTSTVKGEGKTFTAVNLALTLSYTGKKVVLVGADIRNPQIHRYFPSDDGAKGVTNYLIGESPNLEHYARNTPLSSMLEVISSGPIPPNPAELWMSQHTDEFFDSLKHEYDYVIVDTAPCLLVTDTLLISKYADTTLYVVRADYTERKLLDFPKENLENGKLKNVAFVLNNVKMANFGYGNKYGYTYGAEKQGFWKRMLEVFRG
ncbi:GumC family protein [Planktosalinus lacus]|uniref:non-specific protein-tyrosine kinase n=1 Tax=Planktosalinus lacus TaxID=1526573 RepID=A0A8J2VEC5_9FLAO|nr:polysaccharide biosynthesis tyrosine autokinase [Planktosalinus lacus]GGE00342.1 tyrosine protein kinase [Planktosalinus lacus]